MVSRIVIFIQAVLQISSCSFGQVIQQRFDGSVDFYRNWADYKAGFGSIDSEFWLGNDNLHELTSVLGYTRLRIELQAFDGREGHIEFSFSIDDESLQYMIHVSMISGNIPDRFRLANNAPFSTLDRDNDGHNGKVCTTDHHGGWWYARDAFCTEANLNGVYFDTYILERTGIYWFGFAGTSYNTIKGVRMMLRKP
uniref:Angiopoietin-related protein 1 n=1 Tax=Magallana gigas TaxID=29159 RepID=K1R1H0_MAGGI